MLIPTSETSTPSADMQAPTAAESSLRALPRQHASRSEIRQHEEICLLGLPPLWRFLDFVEDAVVDGRRADRAALTDEWRAANDYYQKLEQKEAGIANSGAHRALDKDLAPLAEEIRRHPHYRRTFDTLPTELGMVELDKLIVSQTHVTRTFVDRLKARIGPTPDREAVFRICMPMQASQPHVQICQTGEQRYVFRCESTDLRCHEVTVFRPEQIPDYHSFGGVAGLIAVVVGFGCEFLSVVRVGNRMLLHNGYHRACALRALGLTHVPCIIQTATRVDELQVIVKGQAAENPEFYFESARPPLLKDFFDSKIRKVLPIRAQTHLVEVSFEVKHLVEDPVATN